MFQPRNFQPHFRFLHLLHIVLKGLIHITATSAFPTSLTHRHWGTMGWIRFQADPDACEYPSLPSGEVEEFSMCWKFRSSRLDFVVSTHPHMSLTGKPSDHNRPSLLRSFCGRGECSSSTVTAREPHHSGRHSDRNASRALAASLNSLVATSVEAASDKSRTIPTSTRRQSNEFVVLCHNRLNISILRGNAQAGSIAVKTSWMISSISRTSVHRGQNICASVILSTVSNSFIAES